MSWLWRVNEISGEHNAEEARYIKMCKSRLNTVPDDWEMLTSNKHTQSFCDHHGQVRYFDVRTGGEINAPE
jgi:hypothetical protein